MQVKICMGWMRRRKLKMFCFFFHPAFSFWVCAGKMCILVIPYCKLTALFLRCDSISCWVGRSCRQDVSEARCSNCLSFFKASVSQESFCHSWGRMHASGNNGRCHCPAQKHLDETLQRKRWRRGGMGFEGLWRAGCVGWELAEMCM